MAMLWNPSATLRGQENLDQNNKEKKSIPFPFGPCRVCHDNATGVHYGVITCEGCKGFFKRAITQGNISECFFGGRCIVNIETRNRCKACRFRRCLQEGMSMESVKMGRIPKKVKEQALRERHKYYHSTSFDLSRFSLTNPTDDEWSLSNQMTESSSSSPFGAEHTIVEKNSQSSRISSDLVSCLKSSQSLPSIFDHLSHSQDEQIVSTVQSVENPALMTVSSYISKISENILVDYMFSCEIRYANNVLRTMKYLSPKFAQPYTVCELDFQLTSFFRYLRWKMLKIYSKHTIETQHLIQRMFGIINLGISEYPGLNATIEQMWESIQNGISKNVKQMLDFVEDTPGLNELNEIDLKRILTNRLFDFWILMNYPLFYRNESYMMTIDGLQYTRFFMNKFIGKRMTDELHEFATRLQALNITQIEHSLMIPIVLCQTDPKFVEGDAVDVIKQSYLYALFIQMSATRNEQEAKSLFNNIVQIIDSFSALDELYNEYIRDLLLRQKLSDH